MLRLTLFAGLASLSGCKKDEPTQAAPVPPDDPSNGPPSMRVAGPAAATVKEMTLDLTPCMVPAEIQVPEGTTIARRNHGSSVLQHGPGFAIEIEQEKRPLEAVKKDWQPNVVNWVKDTPTLLVAEIKMTLNTGELHGFVFAMRVEFGNQAFQLHTPIYTRFTKEDVDRMVKSAATVKQTDAIREALKKEPTAIAKLEKLDCVITTRTNERRLIIRNDKVTDDDLAAIRDVTGISDIAVVNASRLTAAGMARIAECKSLVKLSLSGRGITDQNVAPLVGCAGVEAINIREHALTDAGLAFLAGMTNLRVFELNNTFEAPVPPRITGSGFVHLRKATGLQKVHVHGGPVGDAACENLSANKELTDLTIEGTRITDAGVKHLRELTALRWLSLPDNPLGDGGLAQLETLTKLELLDLSQTRVRGQGLSVVQSLPALQRLNLRQTWVTDGGVDRLKGCNLVVLDLSLTPVTDRCMPAFAEMMGLKSLVLRGTRITDTGLVHLGRMKELNTLDVSYTAVNGSGLSSLKGRPSLQILLLKGTLITDAALGELAGCPNLSGLDLDCTGITDAGLERLRDVRKLGGVSLHATEVTAAGVAKLQKDRPGFTVTWNEVKEEPDPKPVAPPIAIDKLPPADPAALIKKYDAKTKTDDEIDGKPVIEVDLSGKDVTDEELARLRTWKTLRVLDLSGCKKITDAGLPYVAPLTNLTSLNLQSTGVHGDGLVHLKGLTNLTNLQLPDERMALKQVAPLVALKALEQLSVKLPEESYGTLRFLGSFPRLKSVALPVIWQNDRHLALIQDMTGIEWLEIHSDTVSDRGLANLKGFKNLKELWLTSELATDEGLKPVGALTGLKLLNITGRRFTDLGLQNLRGIEGLERLKLEGTSIADRGLTHVQQFTKLIELELSHADVGDIGMTHLAEMKDLEFIDLSGTRITDEGLKNFKGMEELRKLTIEDSKITGRGFAAIKKLPRLARLHLARSQINDEGLAAIAQLEAVEQLEINGAAITDVGLAKLKALPNLHDLVLTGCTGLTDAAGDILKTFPALTDVNVRDIGLSPKAIAELRKKEGLNVSTN
jgi:Leucine-rich repeat (LRR) protein